jgi:hypothetical protein
MNVTERIAENAKNSNISVAEGGFTKSQPRGIDPDAVLNEGDIIMFPETMPQVMHQDFPGSDNYAEFIVVNVLTPDGKEKGVNFFPSSLTKNIWPASKDEKTGEVVAHIENGPQNPTGSAVELYKSKQGETGPNGETDMTLGMLELLGKKVKVTSKIPVNIQRWRDGERVNELATTNLLQYDLVA